MKAPNSLPDIQLTRDERNIPLQHVGVSNLTLRVLAAMEHSPPQLATASFEVDTGLEAAIKGSHLSRFVEAAEEIEGKLISRELLEDALLKVSRRLHSSTAALNLRFPLVLRKKAPASELVASQSYNVEIFGELSANNTAFLGIGAAVPVSTACPCSKAISNYGAHNQRSEIRTRLMLRPGSELPLFDNIIEKLERCGSQPVYPLVKRTDEKAITEAQYDNPKFVEDVARDVIKTVRQLDFVSNFELEIESFESIHPHNAVVRHSERLPNG